MIGETVSHYRIIAKLGEGGMGVVYKAEDLTLERPVALKFLSPHIMRTEHDRERFVREAKAAAALNHPNICTVYEIGEDGGRAFIAMEYLDGEDLRSRMRYAPLPLAEALTIAADVARGLSAAHAKGIIHRDIKPANIVVTPDRQVKIMDFGLARRGGGADLTRTGTTVGTISYMSPEQARGEEVDHRTDIWSLGVVLYEMLTGVRPFGAKRDMAVVHSILNEDFLLPSSLRHEVPREIDDRVRRMLAKDRGLRYSDASEVAGELYALTNLIDSGTITRVLAAEEATPSIAVLPFANLTADPEQEYFCDGMAEEIINSLAQLEGLKVLARTSSFAFKGKNEDVREMGRQLGVKALLEGSVRQWSNRLRVTTQLVQVSDGCHLWSERFDREMEDVFAIQDEISLAVTDALKVRLLGNDERKVVKRHTESLEAYHAYLKGRYHWFIRSSESIEKAIEYLEEAISIDPEYALAYAGLADCYAVLPMYRPIVAADVYQKAKAAALKALDLDDELAEAHNALAAIMWNYEWDWDGSDRESDRAIELNPGYAQTYQWNAEGLVERGRFDEAVDMMNRARELDPLSLFMNARLGKVLYYARQYEAAKDILNATLEVDPDYNQARYYLSLVYSAEERYEEALALVPEDSYRAWRAILHAWMGETEKAHATLNEVLTRGGEGYRWPAIRAAFHFALGDLDECFRCMNEAVDVKDPRLLNLIRSPKTDTIKDDPRFIAIFERMGLEP